MKKKSLKMAKNRNARVTSAHEDADDDYDDILMMMPMMMTLA